MADLPDLLGKTAWNRDPLAQAPGARRVLRVSRHEHRQGRVDRRGRVQHVDHRVEIVLERALGPERLRIDGEEEVAEAGGVAPAPCLDSDWRKRKTGERRGGEEGRVRWAPGH